jgi:Zn-dependent protease
MDVADLFWKAVIFVLLFGSVILHEIAHGYVALRLGDPTARMQGRLTLNPLAHIDLFGTIILPLMLSFTGAPVLGWAKPVPINPSYFHDPKRGIMLTGAAGPLTNFAIALIAGLVFLVTKHVESFWFISVLLASLFEINIYLGLFNLIPLPPLDGSRVAVGLMPPAWIPHYMRIEKFGILILFGIIYMGWHRYLLDPPLHLAMKLIGLT